LRGQIVVGLRGGDRATLGGDVGRSDVGWVSNCRLLCREISMPGTRGRMGALAKPVAYKGKR